MINSKQNLVFKKFLPATFLFSLILAFNFLAAPVSAEEFQPDANTLQCASRLFGTMSKEDCEKKCPNGAQFCRNLNKIKGPNGDIDCYVCPVDESCHDIGMDDWIDCFNCDMNPKTECIKAGWMPPAGFGGIGPGGPIGGKTAGGTQCYKCVNKPDKCAATFPGTSWKAACEAGCIAPDKCVFKGVAPDGFDCYKCEKPQAQSCKDLKLLSNADCAACNADPKTQCVMAGFTKTFEACFKCLPKNIPPPPPPPRDCHAYTLVNNCNVCEFLDKDCEFVKVDDELTCARCKDKPKKKECQPPDLDSWECSKCQREGGTCIAHTKQRGDPDCYYCYKQTVTPPPTTCDEFHMPDSCTPNPCSEDEECSMTKMTKKLECAECTPKDNVPQVCDKYKMMSDCATCYRAQMACSQHFVPELGHNCFKCYWPRDPDSCQDLGLPETCTPNPCSEGQVCVRHTPQKGLVCATCMMREDVECPQGTTKGTCTDSSCPSYQNCYEGDGCYECEDKTCFDFDLVAGCQVCETNGKDCKKVTPHPNFTCYDCIDKTPQCPDGSATGACSSSSCSSQEICVPDSNNCHHCEDKPIEKVQCPSGASEGACGSGSCSSNEVCVPQGENCHACEKKKVEEQCQQGFAPGVCTQSSCSSEENCVADGSCHACQPKPKTAKLKHCNEMGMMYLDACRPACENKGICEVAGNDEYGTQCFQCTPLKADDRCAYGFFPGQCYDITCSDDEICVESTREGQKVCHKCQPQPKKEGCAEAGYIPGACPGTCSTGQECVNTSVGQERCHYCAVKEIPPRLCNSGMFPGSCPGVCAEKGLGCTPSGLGDGCYYCSGKEIRTQCPIGEWPGTCPANCDTNKTMCIQDGPCYFCDPNPTYTQPKCPIGEFPGTCPANCKPIEEQCIQDGACYFCDPNPTYTQPVCDAGFFTGSCPGRCDPVKEDCYTMSPGCYACEPKITDAQPPTEPKKNCWDYDLPPNCITCGWRGMDCVDKSPAEGVYCKQCVPNQCRPYLTKNECERCYWEDADCSPVDKNGRFYATGMTVEKGPGPQCYDCDYGERCSDYGLVCDCFACPRGTMCIPSPDRLYDGKPCYACVKSVQKKGDYIIIIIEPMYERYVLKGKENAAGGSGDFVGRKVMALAKVDDVNGIKQIAGLLKGGMNIANIVPINMESLTSTLQQAVTAGGKFTDSCFKDFKATDSSQKLPAGTKTDPKAKKKKDEVPPQISEGYGEDPLANATITGPLIACGESAGKKALMVMDAGGNPTGLITQEIAKKSPDALKAAMQKAEMASDTLTELRQGGWQGLAKKFIGSMIDRGANKVEEAVKDKKKKKNAEPEVQIDPNDPLYEKPEKGKKKKFLGILGGDAPSTPVVIGSSMKFGGRVLGGGADVHKDKEPKTDYQWGLYKIGYTPKSDPQSAWNAVNADEKNVIVAVVDSGLDLNHPDGPRYIWKNPGETPDNNIDDDQNGYVDDVNGWSFLDNNNDLRDFRGHGTFVAGIIAARSNNGQGIAGINPGAVIMPLKVANEEGETNSFNIYRAIHYAVSHGARVINVSLGSHGQSLMEKAAINYAREMGVFVSIAAGNVNENIDDHGPASSLGAFAVGAIDISGDRSTISNWGANNGVLAPAEEIYSLLSKDAEDRVLPSLRKLGYHTESGTSFSSPMVAATASLILVKHPNYTPADIEDVLQRTATDMYEEGWDGKSGAGLLNAAAALRDETQSKLTVKLNGLRKNLDDNKQFDSIDVTATVRGDLDQFTVGVGRGIHPSKFEQVAGPFKLEANNDWIARINDSDMRGSTDWVVRIEAKDHAGKSYFAESAVDLK